MQPTLTTTALTPAPPSAPQPDLRPTADTAALVRDPTPLIPLPMPASIMQKGEVAKAQIATTTGTVTAVERVLKPYGITMLPQGPLGDLEKFPSLNDPDDAAATDDAAEPAVGATPDVTSTFASLPDIRRAMTAQTA